MEVQSKALLQTMIRDARRAADREEYIRSIALLSSVLEAILVSEHSHVLDESFGHAERTLPGNLYP